jgi:Concanavalin A-like lectin/glucanases superfamily
MRTGKLIAGLTSTIVLAAGAPAAANILPTGTWQLNEGSGTIAHDVSGHGDNGAVSGDAAWTRGRFQGGLAFDGNDGMVDVPNAPIFDSPAVTVSAWVKAPASPGAAKYIVAKGANSCTAASYGLYTGASGGLEFYVAGNNGTSWTLSPDAGRGVWNGAWHNVIGTYDGSTVKLYVDGAEVGSGTPGSGPIAYGLPDGNDLTIGNYGSCNDQLDFTGAIDQVRIFDRALGAQEIRAVVTASRYLPALSPFDLVL